LGHNLEEYEQRVLKIVKVVEGICGLTWSKNVPTVRRTSVLVDTIVQVEYV